ncbi:MAG: hypothetical protein H6819_01965 [Phycisphaerales bacterium]|nr:hypothetical protein [Phycisphaerales bacterium]MCB9857022.1 hypothetical protein [Phycisphaerales bacterium]MCB9861851.1 hypothetical protein [Phycisphaerales bacterium]
MHQVSAIRRAALWVGVAAVFVIAGTILATSPRIELGWKTSRRTPEYRRQVRNAMHAATSNGAIHSVDPGRGIMRIDASNWENQDDAMRESLMRLAARYFEVQGRPRKVVVMSAFSNNALAKYDGANSFVFLSNRED